MATRLDNRYIVGNRFIKKITSTHVYLLGYNKPLEYKTMAPCDLSIIHGVKGDYFNLAECIFASVETNNIYIQFPAFDAEFTGELEFVDLPNLKSSGGYRIPSWARLQQYNEIQGMWRYSYTWCNGTTEVIEHDDLFYSDIEDLFLTDSPCKEEPVFSNDIEYVGHDAGPVIKK